MVNWNTVKAEHPKSFQRLLNWFAEQFAPSKVSIEMVDGSGNPSDYHLKVIAKRTPEPPKVVKRSKKKAIPIPPPIVVEVFFQIRELFDFFDDQNIDIDIQPIFRQIVGVTTSKRFYRVVIYMEGNKVYPVSSDVFGQEFGGRRDAEMFSFEKAFQILEMQLSLSGG